MNTLLKFLSGKKAIILGLITTTAAYLGTIGVIDPDTVTFICSIATLIFGGAAIATSHAYKTGKIK